MISASSFKFIGFTPLIVSFAVNQFSSFIQAHLSIFAFVTSAFGVRSKILLKPNSRNIFPTLSSSSLTISGLYVQVFNPFWADFYIWREIRIQFHSSASGYLVFPPCIERLFLLLCFWYPCWRSKCISGCGFISELSLLFYRFMPWSECWCPPLNPYVEILIHKDDDIRW